MHYQKYNSQTRLTAMGIHMPYEITQC